MCSDGIVRVRATGTPSMSDCSKGVVLSSTANSNGLVEVAADEEGNFKLVAVSGNDMLVDLHSNPAVVT